MIHACASPTALSCKYRRRSGGSRIAYGLLAGQASAAMRELLEQEARIRTRYELSLPTATLPAIMRAIGKRQPDLLVWEREVMGGCGELCSAALQISC